MFLERHGRFGPTRLDILRPVAVTWATPGVQRRQAGCPGAPIAEEIFMWYYFT